MNQGEPFRRSRGTKKQKYKIDEALESGKVNIIHPKSLEDIKNEIIKHGNLNNLSIYYDNADDKEQREIEEAIVQYMNNLSRAPIELSFELPKELYDILDIQRNTTCQKDEEMKEYVSVNSCSVISRDEVERLLKLAKEKFRSKRRINKIMLNKIDEVAKETDQIIRLFVRDEI